MKYDSVLNFQRPFSISLSNEKKSNNLFTFSSFFLMKKKMNDLHQNIFKKTLSKFDKYPLISWIKLFTKKNIYTLVFGFFVKYFKFIKINFFSLVYSFVFILKHFYFINKKVKHKKTLFRAFPYSTTQFLS